MNVDIVLLVYISRTTFNYMPSDECGHCPSSLCFKNNILYIVLCLYKGTKSADLSPVSSTDTPPKVIGYCRLLSLTAVINVYHLYFHFFLLNRLKDQSSELFSMALLQLMKLEFYPTAIHGCAGIVFILTGRAGGGCHFVRARSLRP